jgi:hypothetical protein
LPHGLGANRECDNGTIDGELAVTIRQNVFVRTTNQRSRDGTGLDDWALRRQQRQRSDHNVDAEMREKKTIFRLIPTTTQHNEEAGMRVHDLHRQRRQQRTVGLALAALKKAVCFALRKAVCFRFKKNGLFRFQKNGLFVLKKTDFSFLKKRIGSL